MAGSLGGTIAGTPLPRRPCTVLARPTRGRTPEGQWKTARNGARRGRVNRRKRRKTTPPPSGGGERSTPYADSHTSCARPSTRRPPTPPVPAHNAPSTTQPTLPASLDQTDGMGADRSARSWCVGVARRLGQPDTLGRGPSTRVAQGGWSQLAPRRASDPGTTGPCGWGPPPRPRLDAKCQHVRSGGHRRPNNADQWKTEGVVRARAAALRT